MKGGASARTKVKIIALAMVLLMTLSVVPVSAGDDSDAEVVIGHDYTYVMTMGVNDYGANYIEKVVVTDPDGTMTLTPGTQVYRNYWAFGSDGIGPFNSFYATFTDEGQFYELLNPNDLSVKIAEWTINGWNYDIGSWASSSKASHITTCNTLWVLPTVYLKIDPKDGGAAEITFSNKSFTGSVAYAHTLSGSSGDHIYPYYGIGVYEGYLDATDNKLKSISGVTPSSTTKDKFRVAATNTYSAYEGQISMMWNYYQWSMYLFCSYTVAGTMDIKNTYGYPRTIRTTGQGNALGAFDETTGDTVGKLFLENMQGSVWEMLEDINLASGGKVYVGRNSGGFTDNTSDKTYVGDVNLERSFIKTYDFTKNLLGFPLTYTNIRAQSTTADHYISNTAASATRFMVGGGYATDQTKANISSIYNMDNSQQPDRGARLCYVFDTATSGTYEGINWSVNSNGVLLITSSNSRPTVIPDCVNCGPWGGLRLSITSIKLSSHITGIGAYAFCGLENVKSIIQYTNGTGGSSSSYLTVKEYKECSVCLKGNIFPDLYIPSTATVLGEGAFAGTMLHYTPPTSDYEFTDEKMLIRTSDNTVLYINPNLTGNLTCTASTVGAYAAYASKASSLDLSSMTAAHQYAFANSQLKSINSTTDGTADISALSVIPNGLLKGCTQINTVLIKGEGTVDIAGPEPFMGMTNLAMIGILGETASGTIDLTKFTFSTTSKVIFDQKKTDRVDLRSAALLKVSFGCDYVTEMHIKGDVTITSASTAIFGKVKKLSFEDGVAAINSDAYMPSDNILETVSMSQLKDGSFRQLYKGCSKLTAVSAPGVTAFSSNAFEQCIALKSFNSTEDIINLEGISPSSQCFDGCSSITKLSCAGATIGSYAFRNCKALTTIDLPSATTINTNAFYECSSLASICAPKVTTVGSSAFKNCTSLVEFKMDSVVSIGSESFNGCKNLQACTMPSLETIGGYAFYGGLKYFKTLRIADSDPIGYINISGVTSIGAVAFTSSGINNVMLNAGVSLNGASAFASCSNLNTMKVTDDYMKLEPNVVDLTGVNGTDFGSRTLLGCGLVHVKLGNIDPKSNGNDGFFQNNYNLETVETSSTWTGSFGPCCFAGCLKLKYFGSAYDGTSGIMDLRGVQSISPNSAIGYPGNFTKVIVSESSFGSNVNMQLNRFSKMTHLEMSQLSELSDAKINSLFTGNNVLNSAITSIKLTIGAIDSGTIDGLGDIKSKVNSLCVTGLPEQSVFDSYAISGYAFEDCTNLTEVRGLFGAVGTSAFSGCSAFKTFGLDTDAAGTVNLSKIEKVENSSFKGCVSLSTIKGADLTYVGNYAFSGCTGVNVTLGDGLVLSRCTTIGTEAFYSVSGLKGDLVLGTSLQSMGKGAFQGTGIKSVSVKDDGSLTRLSALPSSAFMQCTTLKTVHLRGISRLMENVFNGCSKLELIVLSDAEQFGSKCFNGCIRVTLVTTKDYVAADENGLFISDGTTTLYEELSSATFPNLASIVGFSKVHTISEGMFKNATRLETVSGFSSLTVLPKETFYGCSSLTKVDIPSIIEVGDDAFKGCTSITEISDGEDSSFIMTNVTTLGESVFDGCIGLSTAYLSDSIVNMGKYTFNGCSALDRIQLPANLHTIPSYTFNGCTNLLYSASGQLELPDGVTTIDEHAFDGCTSIMKVVFSENLEHIKDYAFNGCYNAFRNAENNAFIVPSSVTEIGDHAFEGCITMLVLDMSSSKVSTVGDYAFSESGLKTVKFSPVLLSIGEHAFYMCASLTTADLPSSLKYIGQYSFDNCRLSSVVIPERVEDISYAFCNIKGLTYVSLPKNTVKGDHAFEMSDGSKHAGTVQVFVNSYTWTGVAPFTSNDDLSIHSVNGSWNVRERWFGDFVTGEEKTDYAIISFFAGDELWYGGISDPIYSIPGSKIVLPSVKAQMPTAEEQGYLFGYSEGGLKVGNSDDTVLVFGSMDLYSVESAGEMLLHYTSSNPSATLKSPVDRYVSYGETFKLEEGVPNEEGIRFSYWQCFLADGITFVTYAAGEDFSVWRPVSQMSAVWSDTKFTIRLYYIPPGGSTTPLPGYEAGIEIGFGEEIEGLPDINDPSELGYDNYQFKGWYTGPNGTGTKYENGMIMPTKNLDLVAYFTPNPHYVSVYLSPSDIFPSKTVTVYGDTTITAIENNNKLLKYTDASNPVATTFIDADEYESMKGTFISEWKLGSATGPSLEAGDKISSDVNRIYAMADEIEYRLFYKFYDVGSAGAPELGKDVTLNGKTMRSGDYESLSYSDFSGDDLRYPLGQPKTKGLGFVEWKNLKSKTVTYVSEANFVHDGSLGDYVFVYNVNGNFNGSSFTVSYDKNYKGADNSNLIDSGSYKEGGRIGLPNSTVMKRSGYIFEGWTWTAADDPSARMAGGSSIEITKQLIDDHVDDNMVFKFYAQWSAKSYEVLYDVNGGNELDGKSGGDIKAYPDVVFRLASFSVKKNDGYRFIGWCIDPKGQGSKVYADGYGGAIVSSAEISEFVGESSESITFYAIWKKVSYTVKFNLQGGTSTQPLTIEDVKVDDSFALLPEGTYSYPYKNLQYWHIADNTDEGSKFASTVKTVKLTRGMASRATVDKEANIITVTALWADNRYTVTYSLTLDGKISGSANPYPVDKNTYAIGEQFRYPTGDYTLKGYDFKGWSPIAIGDTRIYPDGEFTATFASSTDSNKVTFYAVWEKKTYKIKWELDGGILTNSPFTYVDTVTHISYPVKEGAVFTGWTANNLGTNAMMDSGDGTLTTRWVGNQVMATDFMNLQDADKTVTMIANWSMKEYTLAYSINGGTCDKITWETPRSSIGKSFDLAMVTNGSKTGYTLEGWSLKDGTYVGPCTIDPEHPVKVEFKQTMASASEDGETVWFYALWKPIKYSVRYYADDSSTSYSTVKVSYDEALTLDEPIRSGWEFKGWRGDLKGDAAQYSRNGIIWYSWDYKTENAIGPYFMNLTYEEGGVVEVFGQWERTLYDVAYNFSGGTSGTIDGDIAGRVGESFKFNSYGGSKKTGYVFTGWSVDGVTDVSAGGKFTETMAAYADINDLVTLYAIWSPITYEVQYRFDDTSDYTKIPAVYDVKFALETIDKIGYTFVGWKSDDVNKSTAKYSVTGDYWIQWPDSANSVKGPYFLNLKSDAKDIVHLDAVWEVTEYRAVYNGNGGTGTVPTDDSKYAVGADFKLQPYDKLIGTNGNKNIVGWSTDPEAKVALTTDKFTEQLAKTADITNTVTFYAVWVEGMYTVTVNIGDATVSSTPAGWTKADNNTYIRGFEYGTMTQDVLGSWNSVSITKDGYLFTGWSYDYSKVIDNMTITPVFEKVVQELLYYCIGAIVLIAIIAFAITRIERS